MKLTTIVYLHKTVYLAKNWGIRGRKRKTSKNEAKYQFSGSISSVCEE